MDNVDRHYAGPDRRRHRVYVTRNTEYHCRDGICVAVRDVATGAFVSGHAALRRVAGGVLRIDLNGAVGAITPIETASVGMRLYFSFDADDRKALVTSSIQDVRRPARHVLALYDPS
jgi:hypothetical protein